VRATHSGDGGGTPSARAFGDIVVPSWTERARQQQGDNVKGRDEWFLS
jgi:hypothetical protein